MQFLDAKLLSQAITLSGKDLDIPSVIAVARYGANVKINKNTKISIQRCRDVVEIVVENDMVVYGISTGFGALRSHVIPQEKAIELQRNLIRSHACGVGEPLSAEIVRAAILLRANTLAKGNSGIRVVVIEKLLDMLSKGICPLVPSQGSVGASGDLCPLSHIALVLIGDPAGQFAVWNPKGKMALKDVYRSENVMSSTPENLRSYGYTPLELSYKEGLALNNGTQIMSAIACFVMYDSYWTLHAAELAACLSFEGIQAVGTALDERIHLVRPLPEQGRVSARLRKYLEGSVNMSSPINSGLLYRYAQYIQKNTNIAQKDRKVFASQIQKIIEKET